MVDQLSGEGERGRIERKRKGGGEGGGRGRGRKKATIDERFVGVDADGVVKVG